MQFQFDSLQSFFAMGGHGVFIWVAYASVVLVWGYLALAPKWQTKAFIKDCRRREARQAALDDEEGR